MVGHSYWPWCGLDGRALILAMVWTRWLGRLQWGETLRRLTRKCICAILRDKISSFFQPSQFGVACKAGAEKIVHSLRRCIDENWLSGDFVAFKVDVSNAFNMVSRQAVMDECATFFPELLPWVSWCCGSHTSFWHPMGQISSQSAVQQGDPLGPMLFALVLHKLVTSIDADDDCLQLLLEAWYLDDGVLAGERSAVIRALHLMVFTWGFTSIFPSANFLVGVVIHYFHKW